MTQFYGDGTHVVFLPVGEGRSGDAILVRHRNSLGVTSCYLIDGGFADTADLVRQQLTNWRLRRIDAVINTHPDADHVLGATPLFDDVRQGALEIGVLVMNQPWTFTTAIDWGQLDNRYSPSGRSKHFMESCSAALDLARAAYGAGVPVQSAFAAQKIGPFRVLAPSTARYTQLLQRFTEDPAGDVEPIEVPTSSVARLSEFLGLAATSVRNDSSMVLYLEDGPLRGLFTADAGPDALLEAILYAKAFGLPLTGLKFLQVPHHGSRRNLSSSVLDQLAGEFAIISSGRADPEHPRSFVVGALQQHGWQVLATAGDHLHVWHGFVDVPALVPVSPLPVPRLVEVPSYFGLLQALGGV